MKRRVLVHIVVLFLLVAAEVVIINAASKAQNQPLSFDVVEAISTVAFVFHYFHMPLPLAITLAVVLLFLPAWLLIALVRRFFGLIR